MALISFLSQDEFRNKYLNKLRELNPNVNTSKESQFYQEADAIAEVVFSLQVDAFSLAEEAFIAFATGERLSNLGLEKGIPRKLSTRAVGVVTFSRAVLDTVNYPVPVGTEISTQPDTEGNTVNFLTTQAGIIFGKVAEPTNLNATTATAGGVLLDNEEYFYVITAVDGLGNETLASLEVDVETGNSGADTNSNTLTWDAVANAVSYNIYVGTASSDCTLLTNTVSAFFVHVASLGDGTTYPPLTNNTGSTSVSVAVEAKEPGASGNVPAGAVSRLVDSPAGVEVVANVLPMAGGSNEETDTDYRKRLQDSFIFGMAQSKTTASGYEQTALSVAGVATARVFNPNSGVNRNLFNIYITSTETDTGLPSPTLLALVQSVVNSDDNRSPNDLITVLSPTPINVNVTVQILQYEPDFDTDEVNQTIVQSIQDYINQLTTGEDVLVVGVANAVHDTPGVIDFTVVDPSANIVVNTNEKAVSGIITII